MLPPLLGEEFAGQFRTCHGRAESKALRETAAELTKSEKASISHRGQALRKLELALTTFLGE